MLMHFYELHAILNSLTVFRVLVQALVFEAKFEHTMSIPSDAVIELVVGPVD
jgi:hypothetical protein